MDSYSSRNYTCLLMMMMVMVWCIFFLVIFYSYSIHLSLSKFEVHDIYKQEMEFPTLFTVDMRSKISTFWNSIAKWKPHPGRHVLYTALSSIVYEMYVASYSSVVGFICLFFISDTVWEYLFLMYSKVVYILFWNGKMALTFIELLLRKPSHFSRVLYRIYLECSYSTWKMYVAAF